VRHRNSAGELDKVKEPSMSNRISLSVDEAATAAGIGQTKLREEINAGRLIARKLGKRTLIAMTDLETWIANLPQVAA
jgi:excisionase family DNA binding protein